MTPTSRSNPATPRIEQGLFETLEYMKVPVRVSVVVSHLGLDILATGREAERAVHVRNAVLPRGVAIPFAIADEEHVDGCDDEGSWYGECDDDGGSESV